MTDEQKDLLKKSKRQISQLKEMATLASDIIGLVYLADDEIAKGREAISDRYVEDIEASVDRIKFLISQYE